MYQNRVVMDRNAGICFLLVLLQWDSFIDMISETAQNKTVLPQATTVRVCRKNIVTSQPHAWYIYIYIFFCIHIDFIVYIYYYIWSHIHIYICIHHKKVDFYGSFRGQSQRRVFFWYVNTSSSFMKFWLRIAWWFHQQFHHLLDVHWHELDMLPSSAI